MIKQIIMKELSLRERAAIAFYLSEDKISPSDLYLIAHHKAAEDVVGMKHIASCASHWFSSKPIQDYLRIQQLKQADRQGRERESIRAELLMKKETIKVDGIDYSNPDNRRRLYTQIINRSKDDPKTQLDAAKMFEQIQKDDREAPREQKQSRVYLPLRCEACPLYIKARKELENK